LLLVAEQKRRRLHRERRAHLLNALKRNAVEMYMIEPPEESVTALATGDSDCHTVRIEICPDERGRESEGDRETVRQTDNDIDIDRGGKTVICHCHY